MLNNNIIADGSGFLNEDLSNVKKYDMSSQTIDYKSAEILNIVSDKLFGERNDVKTEYINHFNTNELSALKNSAARIQEAFQKK